MEGMHGAGTWSYRETIGSSSYTSSTSGTILSTTYTSSRASHLSSDLVGEPLWRDDVLSSDLVGEPLWRDDVLSSRSEEERRKKLVGLVEQFCGANGSNIIAALERWFSELDVGWVLQLADDASTAGSLGQDQRIFAGKWIRALTEIAQSIWCTASYFPDHSHLSQSPVAESLREEQTTPDLDQFARFAEASILKMLPFVEAIVAPILNTSVVPRNGAPAPAETLQVLICVRKALYVASLDLQIRFVLDKSSAKAKRQRIRDEIARLMTAKLGDLDEAVWNTIEVVRARILAPTDDADEWVTQNPQGSPDIHKLTRFIISCIKVLWSNTWSSVDQIVRTAANIGKYLPKYKKMSPFISLTTEMVSCLEEKLTRMSQSLSDQSLGFLFLVNNTHFIWQQIHRTSVLEFHMPALEHKIDACIQMYLQVSWAPVLSCLHDRTLLCMGKYSPLPKFESQFLKIYTAQKFWKVPDPELRKRLRKAIIEKVISGFTKYLEDNSISIPRLGVTPQDLEELLWELFEG